MKKILMCVALCCAATTTHASKLGYTVEFRAGGWNFNEPDGDVEKSFFIVPAVGLDWDIGRSSRLVSYVDYWRGDFDGGPKYIHQDVEGYSLGAGIERLFSPSYESKIWVGAILAYRGLSFTDRVTEDSDGFTTANFNDRDNTQIIFGLTAKTYYKKISLGALSEFSDRGQYVALTMGIRI